jgi:peptidoglycan/LPS O-acetylase OafA/YrhL
VRAYLPRWALLLIHMGNVSHQNVVSLPARLRSIDALRGGAALAVMLSHAINYGDRLPESGVWFAALHAVLDYGHLGVPLFFVISGFCIHLRWAKQFSSTGQTSVDFVIFWKRRLHRLYPPYFVMLCLSMGLVLAAYLLKRNVPLVQLYPEPKLQWMGLDFLAHAFMLHGLHPTFDKAGGNPPFWTLAREEYFYLLYAGLLAWRCRLGVWSSMAAVLLLGWIFPVSLRPFLPADSEWWNVVTSSAFVLWFQWCLGMLAVEAYYGVVHLPRWCSWGSMVFVWGVVAMWCDRNYLWLSPATWGLTFFTLLNYCVLLEKTGRWPTQRFMMWLSNVGIFSYSLYLVHNPVRAVLKRFLGPLAATSNPVLYLVATFIICLAGYYAAKLFFALVESRFLHLKTEKPISASSIPVPREPLMEEQQREAQLTAKVKKEL